MFFLFLQKHILTKPLCKAKHQHFPNCSQSSALLQGQVPPFCKAKFSPFARPSSTLCRVHLCQAILKFSSIADVSLPASGVPVPPPQSVEIGLTPRLLAVVAPLLPHCNGMSWLSVPSPNPTHIAGALQVAPIRISKGILQLIHKVSLKPIQRIYNDLCHLSPFARPSSEQQWSGKTVLWVVRPLRNSGWRALLQDLVLRNSKLQQTGYLWPANKFQSTLMQVARKQRTNTGVTSNQSFQSLLLKYCNELIENFQNFCCDISITLLKISKTFFEVSITLLKFSNNFIGIQTNKVIDFFNKNLVSIIASKTNNFIESFQ